MQDQSSRRLGQGLSALFNDPKDASFSSSSASESGKNPDLPPEDKQKAPSTSQQESDLKTAQKESGVPQNASRAQDLSAGQDQPPASALSNAKKATRDPQSSSPQKKVPPSSSAASQEREDSLRSSEKLSTSVPPESKISSSQGVNRLSAGTENGSTSGKEALSRSGAIAGKDLHTETSVSRETSVSSKAKGGAAHPSEAQPLKRSTLSRSDGQTINRPVSGPALSDLPEAFAQKHTTSVDAAPIIVRKEAVQGEESFPLHESFPLTFPHAHSQGGGSYVFKSYEGPQADKENNALERVAAPGASRLVSIDVRAIQPSTVQPRQYFSEEEIFQLADSIQKNGVLQPLIVRPSKGKDVYGSHYELIAGERRWRAAIIAGYKTVPVLVRSLSDQEALTIALIENIQREDLTAVEEAKAIQRLLDLRSMTHEKLAVSLGKSRSYISNSLRLLQLDPRIQKLLNERQLTQGHARCLLGLEADMAWNLAQDIVQYTLSVREVEERIQSLRRQSKKKTEAGNKSPAQYLREEGRDILNALVERLETSLKLKVSIRPKDFHKGDLQIQYSSLEELDALVKRLSKPLALESYSKPDFEDLGEDLFEEDKV